MEAKVKSTKNKHVEELFNAGAHYAYTKSRRHPSAKQFLFGVKNKIEIFDLEKTSALLEAAKAFVARIGANKGKILFVGGKNEAKAAIRKVAQMLNMPYVAGRWIGGTLTNFPEIKKRINKLAELETQKEKGELAKYTKKERLLIDRDIDNLREYFGGLSNLKEMPKALFVIDPRKENIAIMEARQKNVPVIALAGSDCDLKEVTYAIPGNDSSAKSISYFVEQIAQAYREGEKEVKTA